MVKIIFTNIRFENNFYLHVKVENNFNNKKISKRSFERILKSASFSKLTTQFCNQYFIILTTMNSFITFNLIIMISRHGF